MTNKGRYEKAKPAYDALMRCYPFGLEDLDGEEWKPIPDYEDYRVSNYGRIKSFKQGKPLIMKPLLTSKGYLQISLSKNNEQKSFRINRLVAELFIPNPDNKPEVNHIDGFKFNNHVSNLEWATSTENNRHAVSTGLKVFPQGEDAYNAKLTNEQVVYARENPDGLNGRQLAEMFDVDKRTISLVQLGKIYKTVGGKIREAQQQRYTPRIPDNIREQIRAEYQVGVYGCGSHSLAKKYGFNPTTILNIVHES